ncbi:MAG: DUF882 domain-containing protein [Rhizobiales bacterium]|nr:DUF882 domain-containing protein [Hyphomicrobiales bacterium]
MSRRGEWSCAKRALTLPGNTVSRGASRPSGRGEFKVRDGFTEPDLVQCSTARFKPQQPRSRRAARSLALAALLLAITTESSQNAVADGETRTLTIHHTHTREDITVTYKRNGRYDDAALARLNHFLRDWRNNDQTKMDPRLFDVVWEVYQDTGAKQPIQIISAYRSPATNAMLRRRSRGVAQFSQHMLGKAMDFNIPGVALDQICAAGLRLQRGGVGFYPTSGSPFVHLDVGSIRHWPRMSHDQLVRVFPNGRTVHVPSDGRPLTGYAQALADIERRGSTPSGVSLAAARDAGVDTSAATKGRRNLLARIFGAKDEEEEEPAVKTRGTRPAAPEKTEPATRTQVASAVPLPRSRPAPREMLVASADGKVSNERARPAADAGPRTAADIVAARGLWTAGDMIAAASAPAPKWEPWHVMRSRNAAAAPQQATVVKGTTTVVRKNTAARREAVAAIATAGTDITGSLPMWMDGSAGPSAQAMLAYAATPLAQRAVAPAAPMGNLQPPRSTRRSATRAASAVSTAPMPAPQRLVDSPWLRGVIASPSIESGMAVTVMGAPNLQAVAVLMRKPHTAVSNSFQPGEPALFGLGQTFSGAAIAFVPTVSFFTRTAELR